MKLKRLVIQGFKSFKDRTTIHFDDGITGIVGPNGCGKSNIVDALFWVMGEQSAKHLRGSSMKDVIFAGSSKYSPGSFAEATLVLENNTGKHIHIGNKVHNPTEIQLTRKLYRNGESEYRINGNPCRLKDIQEVFMDTGAGAKSYSIIAQGEINKLVQAKPEERRTMIEEVAGITKFKLRRRESLKKIEQTENNLARLHDLKVEIEKTLRSLQKQAEKAERARSLKEKIQRNEIVVNAHKVFDSLKNLRDGRMTHNEKTIEIESSKTRVNELEVSLESERIIKDEKIKNIDTLQKDFNELSKRLAASEERFELQSEKLSDKENLVDERKQELESVAQELGERTERKTLLTQQKEDLVATNAVQNDFAALETKVAELKTQLDAKSHNLNELKISEEEVSKKSDEFDRDVFKCTSRIQELSRMLEDVSVEMDELETQFSGHSGELGKERDRVNQLERDLNDKTKAEFTLTEKLSAKEQKNSELENKTRDLEKELLKRETTLQSLVEINNALEGSKQGVQNFLNETADDNFQVLGNLIKCDDEYSNTVQNLFSTMLDVLVHNESQVQQIHQWLEKNHQGGLEYFIPGSKNVENVELVSQLERVGLSGIVAVSDIVKLPISFEHSLSYIFDGYFIVDEITQNDQNAFMNIAGLKGLITKDATTLVQLKREGLFFTKLDQTENLSGVIARNNKIQTLEEEIKTHSTSLEEAQTLLRQETEQLDEMKTTFSALETDVRSLKENYLTSKASLDSKVENLESGKVRVNLLAKRKAEVSDEKFSLLEKEDILKKELQIFLDKKEELNSQIESLQSEVNEAQTQYQKEHEELISKQVEANTFSEKLSSFNSQIEDILKQIDKLNERKEKTVQMIEIAETEINTTTEDIEGLETSIKELADNLLTREKTLDEMKDDLNNLLMQMKDREDEVKELSNSIRSSEKIVVEIELKREKFIQEEEDIVKNIFEKYRVNLRKALGEFLEYEQDDYLHLNDISSIFVMETEDGEKEIIAEEYKFNRRYGQDLKDCEVKFRQYRTEYNRLGEINWQAIEDYDRQKLRFDFLRDQEHELKESLEDLQNAITHIDEKSRERFKEAFRDVNERFEKVFPIIFGGGNAKLQLKGHIDDPDCGVDIIAQPPGKKMQNINLMSGGEKALTAVSLIFSIFLVKPSPFCLLDEVDAPLDDANVGRFNELLREMSDDSQFILITHNKKTMELNDMLYGVTMQEPGISKAVSVQLH